jgi:hypothetical protein
VVALAVVLDERLPVSPDPVAVAHRHLGPLEAVRRELGCYALEKRIEVRRGDVRPEADEDEPGELAHRRRAQAVRVRVEAFSHEPRVGQAAVELVGPLVVGADQGPGASAGLGGDARAPVAAHVEVGPDAALLVAEDYQLLPADGEQEKVAGLRYLARVTGEEPVLVEDPGELLVEQLPFQVELSG